MDIFENFHLLRTLRNEIEELREFRRMVRQPKLYNTRMNPMQDLSGSEFKQRYRFSKENMLKIIELLRNDLHVDSRGGSIPVELQVMAVIRYWGRHEVGLSNIYFFKVS